MIKYLIIVFFTFLYFFPVHLQGVPSFLSTRLFVMFVGIGYLLSDLSKGPFKIGPNLKPYIKYVLLILIISLITSFFNDVYEGQFIIYPISFIIIALSCYGLLRIMKSLWPRIDITQNTIIDVFTGVILLESILSLALFFLPAVSNLYYSIIALSDLEEMAADKILSDTIATRFLGVGVSTFGAGIAFATCIFLAFVRLTTKISTSLRVAYTTILFFLILIGSAISRTSQVGVVVGLLFLLYTFIRGSNSKGAFPRIILWVGITGIAAIFVINISIRYFSNNILLEGVFQHAFEAFYNYFDEGQFYTRSTEKMINANVWPDNLSTWIIGDGRLLGNSIGYYKNTDIGWNRLLLYFGLIGTGVFMLSQICLIKRMRLYNRGSYFLFILLCLFLSKGMADLIVYVLPFVMIQDIQKHNFTTN